MVTEEQRVGLMLSRLSLEEIGSLLSGRDIWHSASVPSKGVKAIRCSDGPNGVRGIHTFNGSRTTAFPCATALASTWNRDLIYEVGSEMAGKAKAKGVSAVLAPTVNIHRSPLGGRSFESFSEDPVLSGKLGASLVQGLQDQGIAATVKHFVCNDQETDRMKVNTIVDGRSDWFGVSSSAESLSTGLDLEMPGPSIWRTQEQLLRIIDAGKNVLTLMDRVSRAGIEERAAEREENTAKSQAVNRKAAQESIVLLKNATGLLPLQKPSKVVVIGPNSKRNVSTGGGSASLSQYYYVSAYDGIKEACSKLLPDTEVSFSQGCLANEMLPLLLCNDASGEEGFDLEFFEGSFEARGVVQAKLTTKSAQMVFFDSLPKEVTLPAHARVTSAFTPDRECEHEFSLITTGRAKIYVDGQLVVNSWDKQEPSSKFFGLAAKEVKGSISLKALVTCSILVEYSGISSFPDRKGNPLGGGILRIGALPILDDDKLIADAVKAASEAENVILCLGTDQERESEGYDRTDMRLVGYQDQLAGAVLTANPNTVVVNFSGTPVEMSWVEKASTIVQAWFLGSELGNAVADVLFAEFNPCGKIPVSFPYKLEDTPSFGDFPGENGVVTYAEGLDVGYRHYTTRGITTAFPFGHGLSYTSFAYRDLYAENWILDPTRKLDITVDVVNTGTMVGSEIVQLYISSQNQSPYRPKRELQGFEKAVDLAPGAEKTLKFAVDKYSVSFYDDKQATWVAEKGIYNVEIGSSSEKIVLEHEMIIRDTLQWTGV